MISSPLILGFVRPCAFLKQMGHKVPNNVVLILVVPMTFQFFFILQELNEDE